MARSLCGHGNVCVVGDTDQSVYAFRGADFRNILEFEDAFPDVTTIVLDQNYRSTQTILDAANAVIDHNEERKPKSLWTDGDKGDRIVRYFADDEGDRKSQGGYIIGMGECGLLTGESSPVSPLLFASRKLPRIARSSLGCEVQSGNPCQE